MLQSHRSSVKLIKITITDLKKFETLEINRDLITDDFIIPTRKNRDFTQKEDILKRFKQIDIKNREGCVDREEQRKVQTQSHIENSNDPH